MKRFIKVMAVVLLICALIISIIFYGTVAGVSNLNIENTKITSQKVDESLYDLKIAFISDIHYNNFMNYDRLSKMIETINKNKPDIIIFGGDLFDDPDTYNISDETLKVMSKFIQERVRKIIALYQQKIADKKR